MVIHHAIYTLTKPYRGNLRLHPLPPHRYQLPSDQHDVEAIVQLVWVVHGPLVHVANRALECMGKHLLMFTDRAGKDECPIMVRVINDD